MLTRVTGKNPSAIFGKLGVLGNANLFLINPNGIVFGKNASLDINGSFSATTSPSILFNNGFEFSATNPQAPPLLKINLVPGLQYASQPIGNINNAGNLNVDSGKDISLFGNTVSSTGILNAPGGIVSVLGNIISLEDSARIDVSSQLGGGKVFIGGEFQGIGNTPTAKRTFIGSDVSIYADAINFGNGGDVIVWADEVTGFYGKISARGGSLGGNGGLVEVSGKQHLIFRGNVDTFAPIGNTGMLLLDPTDIIIANGSGDDAGDGEDRFIGDNSGILGSILSLPLSDIEDTAPTTIYESELENLSGNTNIVLQATNNITLQDLADDELNLSPGTGFISFAANVDNG
ncbi:MAG: filamentous hemagglutinin N-terminal domain-containing protein, partial [Rivularia sp. ALOHA_DT_140]|nr:filamentous hemagglutinin N-terminal domain-containing protein [Rivularia sp. ALOHA_DT_140]